MRFLFRLDLSFHTNAGKKIEILNFATKQGASFPICPRRWRMGESRWRTVRRAEKKKKMVRAGSVQNGRKSARR